MENVIACREEDNFRSALQFCGFESIKQLYFFQKMSTMQTFIQSYTYIIGPVCARLLVTHFNINKFESVAMANQLQLSLKIQFKKICKILLFINFVQIDRFLFSLRCQLPYRADRRNENLGGQSVIQSLLMEQVLLLQCHKSWKQHLQRPHFSKELTKLTILPDYKHPGMLCLVLPAWRKVRKLDFQSEFSMSKIIRISLIFFH